MDEFPWWTPYQYAGCEPVANADLDGAEPDPKTGQYFDRKILEGVTVFSSGTFSGLFLSDATRHFNLLSFYRGMEQERFQHEYAENGIFLNKGKCHIDGQEVALRLQYERYKAYSNLDFAHGQVELPRNSFWDLLLGSRTLKIDIYVNGEKYLAGSQIHSTGYVTHIRYNNCVGFENVGFGKLKGGFGALMEEKEAVRYAKYWENLAPKQVTPGTTRLDWFRVSSRTGRMEQSRIIYDEFGRQRFRIDFSDHMRPLSHSNPHLHQFDFGPAFSSKGKESLINFFKNEKYK